MMSNILHKPGALQVHLGRNLRERRRRAGLTQEGLAEAAGVSRRMLAAIEAQGANVSLLTVEKLAEALGTTFGDLIAPPQPVAAEAGSPTVMWESEHGSFGAVLGAVRATSAVELWECRLAAGERYECKPDPPGASELLYVVEGEIDLEISGEKRRIGERSSTIFGSHVPYALSNPTKGAACFIRVLTT